MKELGLEGFLEPGLLLKNQFPGGATIKIIIFDINFKVKVWLYELNKTLWRATAMFKLGALLKDSSDHFC